MIPRLHVITDVVLQQRWSHRQLGELAARGGAGAVQLRDKLAADEDLFAEAWALRDLGPRLIVDDRVELARRVGAAGVHLGPDDLPPAAARERLGPAALIGATVNDLTMLEALRGAPIDYIGVGPVFPTSSKRRPKPVLGLEGLRDIVSCSPWPVIAIGGVTHDTAAEVLSTGAWGIAVIGAVVLAADPAEATARLAELVNGARAAAHDSLPPVGPR